MIFNTWTFALFGPVTLAAYWLVVPKRWKPHYLVLAGALFYAWAVPAYLLLIATLALITYAGLRALVAPGVPAARRRAIVSLGVAALVAALVFFKYAKLVASTVDELARSGALPVPHVLVPLAISFFTFEFVHVLVDAYLGKIVTADALEFAVFALFFPTLVAGPIKRYQSFAPQVRAIEPPSRTAAALDLYRIGIGLVKKLAIADSMSVLAQPLVTPGPAYAALDYWVAWLAYAVKIYFDFSGYSDIAIGTAGLLGFAVPENFSQPYRAPNVAVFWRRWHMSLSSWIRDYVFVPLGGSRRPPLVTALNLLLAMIVAGLWHGAAWTFAVWGLWHGAGLVAHRTWSLAVVPKVAALRRGGRVVHVLSVATTFAFVALGWVLFAATSFSNAAKVYAAMF